MYILFIFSIIFFGIGCFLFYKVNQIKIQKSQQQEEYYKQLQKNITQADAAYTEKLKQYNKQWQQLQQQIAFEKQGIDNELSQYRQEKIEKQEQEFQELLKQKTFNFNNTLRILQHDHTNKIDNITLQIEQQENILQQKLSGIKQTIRMINEQRIQEKAVEQQTEFYKLSISDNDLEDVKKLNNLKSSFHNPTVLSKLIWSQYFQKQTTALCTRVLGNKTVSGIYMITNLITSEIYIGKSVNIAERWKQHCKCGLGIQASSTNALYKDMQKYGIWNYTFQVIEQCPAAQLSEKETFWINTYESNKYGLNTVAGKKE